MIRPTTPRNHDETRGDSGDRSRAAGPAEETPPRRLSAEERRKKFEEALANTNKKYGRALRRLAE